MFSGGYFMKVNKKRYLTRIISFSVAAFIVAVGFAVQGAIRVNKLQMNVEYSYQRSLNELAAHIDNINVDLQKAKYAGTSSQLVAISNDIKSEALSASESLSHISVSNVNLQSTAKFISQTGDYANTIAKMGLNNQEITDEDRANMDSIYTNSKKLSDEINGILASVESGKLTLYKLDTSTKSFENENTQQVSALSSGFQDIEDDVSGLPSLIYDGPFSDNTLKKTPELTKNKAEVDREAARDKAANFLGVEVNKITDNGETAGNLPTFNFKYGTKDIEVSKQGGMIVRVIDSRAPTEAKYTPEEAEAKINEILAKNGIENMAKTYFLVNNNVCTVNYAYMQGDVMCYTDLIKVSISLDNCELASFDATGFIYNHKTRTLPNVSISKEDAQKNVSKFLKVNKASLTLIPVGGTGEALCWEFKCSDEKENRDVIDYYNVTNGVEERVLILLDTPGGTLTM